MESSLPRASRPGRCRLIFLVTTLYGSPHGSLSTALHSSDQLFTCASRIALRSSLRLAVYASRWASVASRRSSKLVGRLAECGQVS